MPEDDRFNFCWLVVEDDLMPPPPPPPLFVDGLVVVARSKGLSMLLLLLLAALRPNGLDLDDGKLLLLLPLVLLVLMMLPVENKAFLANKALEIENGDTGTCELGLHNNGLEAACWMLAVWAVTVMGPSPFSAS